MAIRKTGYQRISRRLRAVLRMCAISVPLLLGMMAGLAQAAPQTDAIVRCDPSLFQANSATTLSIDLYIQDVAELYGADVRLDYNPVMTKVKDADNYSANGTQVQPLSGFLAPDFVIRNQVDPIAGSIWYAASQIGTSHPDAVSGSGSIARVTFDALQAGEHVLHFTFQKLAKKDGAQIPATTQDCTIGFWGPIDLAIALDPAGHNLTWTYLGNSISRAEMWRSTTNPYLLPNDGGATELLPGPAAGATAFTDDDIASSVNQYYIARAVHDNGTTKSAPSNRVGAFHFALIPGATP